MKWVKRLVAFFFASTILAVVVYRFVPVPVTPLMVIRCAEQVADGRSVKCHHDWVPLSEMSKHLPVAVMASEDQRFLFHHGIDFDAVKQAHEDNKTRKRPRGGSTITQQTAKNVFLWLGGGFFRKGLEAYFSLLMELFWSKQRIMEVYLNSIEMGDGIYGAEAVAQQHFNKKASQLTREECALIAATLPNPRAYSSKNPSNYMKKRKRWIERQMKFMPSFPKEGEKYDPATSSGGIYSK